MTPTTDQDAAATIEVHRLGRQTIDDAATALTTRAALDNLLLDSLSAPGLKGTPLQDLRDFLNGAGLAMGQAALDRCAQTASRGRA